MLSLTIRSLSLDPSIVVAIIAGAISVATLLFNTLISVPMQRKKFVLDYDVTLRADRLTEYRKLWKSTEPIGRYGDHEITQQTAQELLTALSQWYFENGAGLFLSVRSLSKFEKLLSALRDYDGRSDKIHDLGTELRAALAYDIGGRNLPALWRHISRNEL